MEIPANILSMATNDGNYNLEIFLTFSSSEKQILFLLPMDYDISTLSLVKFISSGEIS